VIELYEESGGLVMKISDNGIGIYPDNRRKSNSFGLIGIEERILALDGKFQIDSTPGKGASLMIFIPLGWAGKEKYPHSLEEYIDP
jgi:signal transduction histidine kinase